MKKTIEAENVNFAIKNTEKYLEAAGFNTSGSDIRRCTTEQGYCERFNKPDAEAWVSYIHKNKFEIEILKY